jgi:hypothetical protein
LRKGSIARAAAVVAHTEEANIIRIISAGPVTRADFPGGFVRKYAPSERVKAK